MENTDSNFEGPLEKVSPGVLKNKTKVWVTLTQDSLSLYRIDKRSSCIGSIQLCDVQKVQCSTPDSAMFEVVGSIKSYKFKAESCQSANEWKCRIEQRFEINSSEDKIKPGHNILQANHSSENQPRVTHSDETDLSSATSLFGVRLKSTRREPNAPPKRPSGSSLMLSRSTLPAVSEERSQRDVPRIPLPVSTNRSSDTTEFKSAVTNVSDLPGATDEDTRSLDNTSGKSDDSIFNTDSRSMSRLTDDTNVQTEVAAILHNNEPESEPERVISRDQSQDEHNMYSEIGFNNPTDVQATRTVSAAENLKLSSEVLPNETNKDEEIETSGVVLRRSAINRRTVEFEEAEDTAVDTSEVQMRHSSRSSRSRSARSLQNGSRAMAVSEDVDREGCDTVRVTDTTQIVDAEFTASNTNGRTAEEEDGTADELLESVFGGPSADVDERKPSVATGWLAARSTAFETLKSFLESNSEDGFRLDKHVIKELNAVRILKDLLGM